MNQNVKIDLTAVADLDVVGLSKKTTIPQPKTNLPGEQTLLDTALKAYVAAKGTRHAIVDEMLQFKDKPTVGITTVGAIKAAPTKKSKAWTIAGGPSGSAGAGAVLALSGGVYFSNVPEIGLFGSISVGAVTNVGASICGQVSYMFGAPKDVLAGESLVVGVEVGVPGKIVAGGGYLILSTSAPLQLIGISFALGVGASILPVDITIQVSKTCLVGAGGVTKC